MNERDKKVERETGADEVRREILRKGLLGLKALGVASVLVGLASTSYAQAGSCNDGKKCRTKNGCGVQ